MPQLLALLSAFVLFLASPTNAYSNNTKQITIPAIHIPARRIPAIHIPARHIPARETPMGTIPAIDIPEIHIPAIHIPAVDTSQGVERIDDYSVIHREDLAAYSKRSPTMNNQTTGIAAGPIPLAERDAAFLRVASYAKEELLSLFASADINGSRTLSPPVSG